jgi:hypothetical protein
MNWRSILVFIVSTSMGYSLGQKFALPSILTEILEPDE